MVEKKTRIKNLASSIRRMKIKFVHLESDAFLTDIDFIQMSPSERGVYCSLILYLYSSGGKCEFDMQSLGRLCNCGSAEEFEKIWDRISKKFTARTGVIKHKRVTKELTRAKKFIQRQCKAGLASAKEIQQRLNRGSAEVIMPLQPTKTKGNVIEKENKDYSYSNTTEQSYSVSSTVRPRPDKDFHIRALHFKEALMSIIKPRNQSERTCFRDITSWLMAGCAAGKFNE